MSIGLSTQSPSVPKHQAELNVRRFRELTVYRHLFIAELQANYVFPTLGQTDRVFLSTKRDSVHDEPQMFNDVRVAISERCKDVLRPARPFVERLYFQEAYQSPQIIES